jgi:outer membrane putative beta-barrel porin/alpha-amylase
VINPYVRGYLLLVASLVLTATDARADTCPQPTEEIATDRPDVTNSAIVVPVGSLQNENGINTSAQSGRHGIDGTNSRWRLGVAPCLEVFVDLPTYFLNAPGTTASGFSDVSPAIKWQISPVPGKIDLSIVSGVALPTGAAALVGHGPQPYVQMPWSSELHGGWGISGMFTEFFRPDDPSARSITETTFVIEKKLTERFSAFTEYVGDYPQGQSPIQTWNSGGLYHLTRTQQLDFHVAIGLNHNAPTYAVGLGYSFRVDGLFR